jgi:gluconate 2-dehydrogenase gamma chain
MHEESAVNPARRRLFQAAGAASLAAALPVGSADAGPKASSAGGASAAPAAATPVTYLFFNPAEAKFIEAAVARLIPQDEAGPGALEAGVPEYIDRQLSGAWGAGDRLYRSGPWHPGTPSQGYQLPFAPAELFRNAIRALNEQVVKAKGAVFESLAAGEQDAYLDSLENGKDDLGGVPSNVFFASLLQATIEGFFSDPAYGGNRDMVAWKMIGFPGAYADYYELVDRHGVAYTAPPTSLAQDSSGRIHLHAVRPVHRTKEDR